MSMAQALRDAQHAKAQAAAAPAGSWEHERWLVEADECEAEWHRLAEAKEREWRGVVTPPPSGKAGC